MQSGISFMKALKSIGPKWDPCGTPEVEINEFDRWPLMATLDDRLSKYEENHFSKEPDMPRLESFCNNRPWSTLSKALLKSVYIESTGILLSRDLIKSEV